MGGRQSNSLRFTALDDGKKRGIFSVAENGTGDLIINLYAKQLGDGLAAPISDGIVPEHDRGKPVKEHRYTVHCSPNSDHTNTIKLHLDYLDGTSFSLVQSTTAIKGQNQFTPIYARLCSAMQDPGYDFRKGKGGEVSLGPISTLFTLVFAVFVGPSGAHFDRVPRGANRVQRHFTRFSVVVLWSYLTMPSTNHSRFLHFGSAPERPTLGNTPEECMHVFDFMRNQLRAAILNVLDSEPALQFGRKFFHASTYISVPEYNSEEAQRWGASLHGRAF